MTEGNSEVLGHQSRSPSLLAQILQYGVACLSVALAQATNVLFYSYLEPTPTPVFFAAIMVSVWFGGLGPGLLATALSTLAIDYFYIEPFHSLHVASVGTLVRLDIFVMTATLMSGLNQAQRSVQRNEERLQRTSQTLQTLLDACPIAIAFFDSQGIVKVWNQAAERIFGWSAEETIGQFMPTVSHRRQEFLTSIQTVLSGRALNGFEAQHQRKDGRMIDLEIWANLTHDAEGKPGCLGIAWDITERKQVEAALRQSDRRFKSVFNQQFQYMAILTPEGRIVDVNESPLKATGIRREDVIGQLFWETPWWSPLPDVQAMWVAHFTQVVRDGTPVTGETYYATGDGTLRFSQYVLTAVRDETDQVVNLIIQASDLTDRKQVEETLRASEERFQLIAQASNDVIWDYNLLTCKIWWSERAQPVFGYSPEELGTDTSGWVKRVHPDDLERVQASYRAALNSSETIWTDEYRFRRAEGSYADIHDRAVIIRDTAGTPTRVVGAMSDISDRKRVETERQQAEANLRDSEERLRLALIAANQGLYDLNVQTGEAIVSPEYARMLGYNPDEFQETNAKWRDRLHPDDVNMVYQAYEDYVSGKLDTYRVEFRQRTQSGNWKWILSIGRIVAWDREGQPLRMLGTHTDITDRKQAEAEREQLLAREKAAREAAETANRIKDEFLAVLSHELRSPLNPILGWSKLLQTRKLDEQKTRQALTTIERNAKLQTQLIEDLLDVSRILRGKLVLNMAPVSLSSTIEAALETVKLAVEAKAIDLRFEVSGGVDEYESGRVAEWQSESGDEHPSTHPPIQVMGDGARLQQVIWNLLTNAVKFTPEGGRVEVRLEKVATDEISHSSVSSATKSVAQIQVKDTGKGINPDFLPYVFDYFRQEDGTTTRKFGGLGLGLAIVRHITELHGGTVWAESLGEGMGATFTVQLPLLKAEGSRLRDQNTSPPSALCPLPLQNVQILAVDDDEDIRELLEFILQQAGAKVRVVASATEVLQQLEAFAPEVFISDIGMPDFDGYMLMRQIRTLAPERKKIPAIALTAYAAEIDQQRSIAAGFQMHLAKPVEPEELISAITNLLQRNGADEPQK